MAKAVINKVKSRYASDCSVKGVVKNFIKIKKDASVKSPLSTGSKIVDKAIKKEPVIGSKVNMYNKAFSTGALLSHGVNAYRESCKNGKRK